MAGTSRTFPLCIPQCLGLFPSDRRGNQGSGLRNNSCTASRLPGGRPWTDACGSSLSSLISFTSLFSAAPSPELIFQRPLQRTLQRWKKCSSRAPLSPSSPYSGKQAQRGIMTGPRSLGEAEAGPCPDTFPDCPLPPWSVCGGAAIVRLQPLIIPPGASSLFSKRLHVAIRALGSLLSALQKTMRRC